MWSIIGKLRSLDAYAMINEDFYSRITIISSIIMLLLFISDLALACSIVRLDAMDISGGEHLDVKHDIIKKTIDTHGNVVAIRPDTIGAPKRHGGRLEHNDTYCGSCFGAETSDNDCCNNCEEVREAFRKKGWAVSNPDLIDQISHKINRLAFGDSYPGVVNPFDGLQRTMDTTNTKCYVSVFPQGSELGQLQALPGTFFYYDLSPIKVTFMETHSSFLHFLTNICAIIGGVSTVSGILDSFVYHGQKAIKRKM